MSAALVSIIIPSYNAGPWIKATIESALAQTWPTKEIIVVDDGSKDNSLTVASEFRSAGVQVVAQANAGASAARNHGLRLARGEYIQFLDADDLMAPDKIARQMEIFARTPRAIVAAAWGRFENDPSIARFVPEENWRDSEPIEWLTLNYAGRGMMQPAAWLTPRALIDAAGPWDERLSLNDDGEYFTRVILRAETLRFCSEARVFYRSNLSGSLSRQRSARAWRSALLSQELCISHLLAVEDSARTRRASADLMQRLAFGAWPDAPDVVARAEELVKLHGGSAERPGGGRVFQLLCAAFGWKFARRIQARRQG